MHRRLRQKGWSEKELKKFHEVNQVARSKKSLIVRFLDRYVFWFLFLVAVIADAVITIVLVPLVLMLQPVTLYLLVVLMGISFGLLFENILSSIDDLSFSHHVLMMVFIPAFGAFCMMVFVRFSQHFAYSLGMSFYYYSPVLVGWVYGLSLFAPLFVKYKHPQSL